MNAPNHDHRSRRAPSDLIEWAIVKRLPRWYAVWGAWVLIAVAVGYVFVDKPVEQLMRYQLPDGLFRLADRVTVLGLSGPYLIPLAVLAGALALLRRHALAGRLAMMFTAIAATGIFVNIVKVLLGRFRPNAFFARGEYGFDPISFGYNNASFPSGHAAVAAAVGASLCILLPAGRWVWVVLYGTVAATRVLVSAHYVSDVIAGAFVGVCMTIAVRDAFRALGVIESDAPLRYTFVGSAFGLTCRTAGRDDPQR